MVGLNIPPNTYLLSACVSLYINTNYSSTIQIFLVQYRFDLMLSPNVRKHSTSAFLRMLLLKRSIVTQEIFSKYYQQNYSSLMKSHSK